MRHRCCWRQPNDLRSQLQASAVPGGGRHHRLPGDRAGWPAGGGLGQYRVLRPLLHPALQGQSRHRRAAGGDHRRADAGAGAARAPRQVRYAADDQAGGVLRRGGGAAGGADLPGVAAVRFAQHRVVVRREGGIGARSGPEPRAHHHGRVAGGAAEQGPPDRRADRRRFGVGHRYHAEPAARAVRRAGGDHLRRQRPRGGNVVEHL